LPQGSHTPDEVFLIPCRVFSFFWCFCSSAIRSGSIVFSYSSSFAAMYWALHGPFYILSYLWYTSEFVLVFLLGFFFFSLKSPGPFFGYNRSESQDSLVVILTAPPPSTLLVTLRFICSYPNFLPLNNLVLFWVSSFLMLFFIHCSAPVSVLLPLWLFVFLR
jgi:hypothetical protein